MGVIISPEEYERLSKVVTCLDMLRLSQSVKARDLTAEDLYHTSREELDGSTGL